MAREVIEHVRQISEGARVMWSGAQRATREAQQMREDVRCQIEELAKDSEFRGRYWDAMLRKILRAAIKGTHADMGNIQLLDPSSGRLIIQVHYGFRLPFLDFFNCVESGQAACGAALQMRSRIIVGDTANSEIFLGTRSLEVMLDAKVRAVQSTPLIGRSGQILGVLSTHYQTPREPGHKELRTVDHLARKAAELMEWHTNGGQLPV